MALTSITVTRKLRDSPHGLRRGPLRPARSLCPRCGCGQGFPVTSVQDAPKVCASPSAFSFYALPSGWGGGGKSWSIELEPLAWSLLWTPPPVESLAYSHPRIPGTMSGGHGQTPWLNGRRLGPPASLSGQSGVVPSSRMGGKGQEPGVGPNRQAASAAIWGPLEQGRVTPMRPPGSGLCTEQGL